MGGGPYRQTDRREAVERLRAAQRDGAEIQGEVVGANQGGLLVQVEDAVGFLPRSQMKRRDAGEYRSRVGRSWSGWVLNVTSRKLILTSHGPGARRRAARRQDRFLERLSPGSELRGTVSSVKRYGAFVRLGRHGPEGLIVRRELSWWRVGHPAEIVSEGQPVRVRVLELEPADPGAGQPPRVALSLRRTQPNPWRALAAELRPGTTVRCRVESRGDSGVWLRLTDHPKVQSYLKSPEPLEVGSTVWARVEWVSTEMGRLYLEQRLVAPPRN